MSFRNRVKALQHVRAGDLIPNPLNWRRHPQHQRELLRTSLEEVGYADAVIARQTDAGLVLIDGHLRAGIDDDQVVPVLVTDLTEDEAGAMLASLDPLAGMAVPDVPALDRLLSSLKAKEGNPINRLLDGLVRAKALPASKPPSAGRADAVIEPPADPISQPGDIWRLGKHRLMCGDSTDAGDVEKLLAGAKPRLMVTDPPYGVGYDPDWRNREPGVGGFARHDRKLNPYPSRIGVVSNDETVDWSAAAQLSGCDVVYVWMASLHVGEVQVALEAIDYELRTLLIWRKQHFAVKAQI